MLNYVRLLFAVSDNAFRDPQPRAAVPHEHRRGDIGAMAPIRQVQGKL